ncbi:hypothetical protein BKI52_26925 [marine bacterium AO1-C]|nr:hypothetical protein BKI52_26925 [marine bacterium AO1-C]
MANFSVDNSLQKFSSESEENAEVNIKFARNFDASLYNTIYELIRYSFANFPMKGDQKIAFNLQKDSDLLSITLKPKKIKIKFSSSKKKSSLNKTTSNLIKTLEKL